MKVGSLQISFSDITAYAALAFLAVVCGLAVVIAGPIALILVIAGVLALLVLYDFRLGVMLLILLMPISATKLFPHQLLGITGLNPLNLILLATFVAYLLRAHSKKTDHVLLPPKIFWFYILPIMCAGFYGALHANQIPAFYLVNKVIQFDNAWGYLRDVLIKPLFFVLFSLLVGAAVKNSQKSERFLVPALISLWMLAIAVVGYFLLAGVSLSMLAGSNARNFLSALGLHANELGMLFNMAYALFIFCLPSAQTPARKIIILLSLAMFSLVIMLTFSRAAFIGFAVVNAFYFYTRKQIKWFIFGLIFAAILFFALPDAVFNRLTTGLVSHDAGEISAGRLDKIWLPLLPSVLESPLFGHGLSSVLWSSAAKTGRIMAVGHPHNAYLGVLLDLGFIGFGLLLYFFWIIWKQFRILAKSDPEPILRGFFEGASIALILLFLQGFTDDRFVPTPPQVFLWFSIGLMLGRSKITTRIKHKMVSVKPKLMGIANA